MEKSNQPEFTDQSIYIGIDVHKKSWAVSIRTEQFEHKTYTQPPEPRILAQYLHRTFPNATYYAAYEAGYSGFWIHDDLNSRGVKCVVIHPADIPITDKDKRRKNDPRDCRRIARGLRNGELNSIYVPPIPVREERSLMRRRMSVIKDKTRIKNRIKSWLQFNGILIPNRFRGRCWSRAFKEWLDTITLDSTSGEYSLKSLLNQLRFYEDEEMNINRQIRTLSKSDCYRHKVKCLTSIPGIGIISAMTWLTELVEIHRFKSFDHLASYVGLVPRERSSGEKRQIFGIDTRGNRTLRTLLIENAWAAVRKDTGLIKAYQGLIKRMHGNQAIIRIARKLLRRIRFVLVQEKTYEIGIS